MAKTPNDREQHEGEDVVCECGHDRKNDGCYASRFGCCRCGPASLDGDEELAPLMDFARAAVTWWDAVSTVTTEEVRQDAYYRVGLAMGALPDQLLRQLEQPSRRAGKG